ncbi:hypothetical protein OR1_04080 [Geobacter sp. OR-1]|uniref:hypothetical protein n=1 Tax=Geobacter sp. OR-1 TaxID=1266765 RepID=UPI000542F464|nr:hypothetical protein [Geobacter sp. OR-1]GAM11762.1 hypothetical protein OR1_04080 [Geobacter sp. OR-1]
MKPQNRREINLYLTEQQHTQIASMRDAGFTMSAIARLAIRKFADTIIPHDDANPKAKRVILYLDPNDYSILELFASKHDVSLATALRCLISQYLSVKSEAIASLF